MTRAVKVHPPGAAPPGEADPAPHRGVSRGLVGPSPYLTSSRHRPAAGAVAPARLRSRAARIAGMAAAAFLCAFSERLYRLVHSFGETPLPPKGPP